jgi:hypothetical protein
VATMTNDSLTLLINYYTYFTNPPGTHKKSGVRPNPYSTHFTHYTKNELGVLCGTVYDFGLFPNRFHVDDLVNLFHQFRI